MIGVRRVDGDDPTARRLVAAMASELGDRYGPIKPDPTLVVDPDEMTPPHGCFVLLAAADRVVAGGGVRRLGDGVAEIKRMYVVPDERGRGHGRRLLRLSTSNLYRTRGLHEASGHAA